MLSWRTLRRRGWVVPVVAALTVGAALGVRQAVPERYTAEAILAVPAVPDQPTGSLDQASRLAATYAQIVPNDRGIVQRVAARVSLSRAEVRRRLSAGEARSTPVLRVRFVAATERDAVRGADAAAMALARDRATTTAIAPGSVELVRAARQARRTPGGRWRSEAVVVVSAGSATATPGDAGEANALARTYATLIPEDRRILRRVGAVAGVSAADVGDRIGAVNEFDTSVLRLRFRDDHPGVAVDGIRALALAVTGERPATPRIAPRSIRTVDVDDRAERDTVVSDNLIPVAAVLGVLLGLVILVAWDRADPRVDDLQTLSGETFCPASDLDALTADAARALVERWRTLVDARPVRVALVPAGRRAEAAAAFAAARLEELAVPAGDRFEPAYAPGGPSAGERLALSADLPVLVVVRGTRVAELRRTVSVLEQFGTPPRWALLVSRNRVREWQQRSRETEERGDERAEAPVGTE